MPWRTHPQFLRNVQARRGLQHAPHRSGWGYALCQTSPCRPSGDHVPRPRPALAQQLHLPGDLQEPGPPSAQSALRSPLRTLAHKAPTQHQGLLSKLLKRTPIRNNFCMCSLATVFVVLNTKLLTFTCKAKLTTTHCLQHVARYLAFDPHLPTHPKEFVSAPHNYYE